MTTIRWVTCVWMAGLLLMAVGPAAAQPARITCWQHDPAEPGRWYDPANWTHGVPTPRTIARIDNGGTAVVYDTSTGAAARWLVLGGRRRGTVEQIGGVLKIDRDLRLGLGGYGEGRYLLEDGRLFATHGLIDSGGAWYPWGTARPRPGSVMKQSGGEATFFGTLDVGAYPHVHCDALTTGDVNSLLGAVYALGGGELRTDVTTVGVHGTGRFVQTGGAHDVAGALKIGGTPRWRPTTDAASWPSPWPVCGGYTLRDGKLHAGRIELGLRHTPVASAVPSWSRATFQQLGGGTVVDGAVTVRDGCYRLGDGRLAADSLYLSGAASNVGSQFTQTGGSCVLDRGLYVGLGLAIDAADDAELARRSATAVLAGGTLHADRVHVGGRGRSLLSQTGGGLSAQRVQIAGPDSAYNLQRGGLKTRALVVGGRSIEPSNVPGSRLNLGGRDAEVRVTDLLAFDANGRYTAEDGTTIRMTGADHANYSTTPTALLGLDHTRMLFEVGPASTDLWSTYEVAGRDLGPVRQGWYNNFQLETLQVGGDHPGALRLANEFDNQPVFPWPEALYVRYLRIGPDSRLDLNGLNLYYLQGEIDPAADVVGGMLAAVDGGNGDGPSPIPEPATILLVVPGLVGLLRRRR